MQKLRIPAAIHRNIVPMQNRISIVLMMTVQTPSYNTTCTTLRPLNFWRACDRNELFNSRKNPTQVKNSLVKEIFSRQYASWKLMTYLKLRLATEPEFSQPQLANCGYAFKLSNLSHIVPHIKIVQHNIQKITSVLRKKGLSNPISLKLSKIFKTQTLNSAQMTVLWPIFVTWFTIQCTFREPSSRYFSQQLQSQCPSSRLCWKSWQ